MAGVSLDSMLAICEEIRVLLCPFFSSLELVEIHSTLKDHELNAQYAGYCHILNDPCVTKHIYLQFQRSRGSEWLPISQIIPTLLHEFAHCINFDRFYASSSVSYLKVHDHGGEFYQCFREVVQKAKELDIYQFTMNASLERIDSYSCDNMEESSLKIGYSIRFPDSSNSNEMRKSESYRIQVQYGKSKIKSFLYSTTEELIPFLQKKFSIQKSISIEIVGDKLMNNCLIKMRKV
jgi:hypothetical protein